MRAEKASCANRAGGPLVSIGMPVYNGERHLAQAIESVLAQTLGDFELIVSDNASTDASVAIVRRYMAHDPRIRLCRFEVNRGATANWNRVAREARGRYFKWLAASDEMAPGLLAECVRALEACPDVVLAFGQTRWIDGHGASLALCDKDFAVLGATPAQRFAEVSRNLSINNQINAGVIRMAALRRTSLLRDFPSADLVLMAELALQGPVVLLPQELFKRRAGPEVSTPDRSPLQLARHYNPGATRPARFISWRRQAARYAACWRAPLPLTQKAAALAAASGLVYEAWQRRHRRARAWLQQFAGS